MPEEDKQKIMNMEKNTETICLKKTNKIAKNT